MSHVARLTDITLPLMRTTAIVALLGATALALPTTLRAEPLNGTAIQLAQAAAAPTAAANRAEAKAETVEQRITNLHAQLKITSEEESKWNAVAQAMRDNASKMEKLVADKRSQAPQNMTAVDDLQTYQQFAEVHVDGLKSLNSAFKSLYDSMPDAQKKIADQVFANSRRTDAPSHG